MKHPAHATLVLLLITCALTAADPNDKTVTVPPDEFPEQNYLFAKPGETLKLTVTSPKGIATAGVNGGAWVGGVVGDTAVFTELIMESFAGVHKGNFFGTYKPTPGAGGGGNVPPPTWKGSAIASVLVVKDNGVKKNTNDTVLIAATPEMPKLTAQLIPGTNLTGNAEWKMVIAYTQDGRNDSDDFPSTPPRTLAANTLWDIANEYAGRFRGGRATITVAYGGKTQEVVLNIKGTNPDIATMRAFIRGTIAYWYAEAMARTESSFRQFGPSGNPLAGGEGFGIFQLDTPAPTAQQLWNWHDNVREAGARMAGNRAEATTWITNQKTQQMAEEPTKPLAEKQFVIGPLTYQEGTPKSPIDAVAIQRYNGAFRYVIFWKNKTVDTPGSWEIQPGYTEYVTKAGEAQVALFGP